MNRPTTKGRFESKDRIVQLALLLPKNFKIKDFSYKVKIERFGYSHDSQVTASEVVEYTGVFIPYPKGNKNGKLCYISDEYSLFTFYDYLKVKEDESLRKTTEFTIYQKVPNQKNTIKRTETANWHFKSEGIITQVEYHVTSAENATPDNTKKTQHIGNACTHTVDGAVRVAEYIVGEIKRNVKSTAGNTIRNLNRIANPLILTPVGQINKTEALGIWIAKVKTKGEWDHKWQIYSDKTLNRESGITVKRPLRANDPQSPPSESHYHKYKNYDYYYDVWSNIHYGYVGLSVGFTEIELIKGSALQQRLQDSDGKTSGGDSKDDVVCIKLGFNLYKKFGQDAINLKAQDILDLLDSTPREPDFKESKQVHWCYNSANPNRVK